MLQYDDPERYILPQDFADDLPQTTAISSGDPVAPAAPESAVIKPGRGAFKAIAPFIGTWLKKEADAANQLLLVLALTVDSEIAKIQVELLDEKRPVIDELRGKWRGVHMDYPSEHWRCLRTNNPLERLMREIRRRTRAVGAFPDGQSALILVAARLRHVAGTKWGAKRYLDMGRLRGHNATEESASPTMNTA